MGIEDLGLLLENIEEYVMEQRKVVTYKWLSRAFSLNVNQAKQLLCIFHMKHKNMKHKSIQGVYYVSGMRTNSQGQLTHQVCIVTEDELEATKAQLDPLTGVHLYSVQKGRPKDTAPIYAVDFEQLKKKVFETTEFSMVRCEEAKISQVINSVLRPVTPPALKNKVKVMVDDKPKGKFEIKKSAPSKKHAATKGTTKTTIAPKRSTVKPKPKQENLANFFSKGKTELKKFEPKKPVVKKFQDLKKFSPRKTEPKKSHTACVKESVKELPEMNKIRITSPGKKTKPLEPPVIKEMEVLSVKEPEKKTYSRLGSKRKRVRRFSDEEDEKEKEVEEDQGICLENDEDQYALPEEKPPECKKTKINGEKKRKRVKKLVSKTTLNEDGFMETEKVWEEQSCTDDDEEVEAEEVSPSTVPVKTKQSNLMGFFKKS